MSAAGPWNWKMPRRVSFVKRLSSAGTCIVCGPLALRNAEMPGFTFRMGATKAVA
jgi:hypothetical protein